MRLLRLLSAIFLLVVTCGFPSARAEMVPGADINSVKEAKRIDTLLRQPAKDMDLARIKLTIDKMIDPSINVDAGVKQIDGMAAQVHAMLRGAPSSNERHKLFRHTSMRKDHGTAISPSTTTLMIP